MSLGLEATMGVLDAVELLIVDSGAAFEDGKISFRDLRLIPDAVRAINALVGDIKPSMMELKDLDKDELVQIVQKLLEVVEKAYEAFKPAE